MSHILFIDDDQVWQNLLKDILETAGHALDSARSFESAINKLNEQQFDVIVFDLFLSTSQSSDDPFIWVDALVSGLLERDIAIPPIIIVTGYPVPQRQIVEAFTNYRYVIYTFFEKYDIDRREFLESIRLASNFRPIAENSNALKQHNIRPNTDISRSMLNHIQAQIELDIEAQSRVHLFLYLAGIISIWLGLIFLTIWYGWEQIEPWTYFLGGGVSVGSYIYFMYTLQEFTPKAIYEKLRVRKMKHAFERFGLHLESSQQEPANFE